LPGGALEGVVDVSSDVVFEAAGVVMRTVVGAAGTGPEDHAVRAAVNIASARTNVSGLIM
jgi:hypothetical protein